MELQFIRVIFINMIRLKHILEQTSPGRNNVIITAYNQIVNASAGWGTNPDAIVAAIGLLKTPTEFAQLLEQFKNKKTGYSSFNDMINEEYDRFNYSDIVKLVNKLKSIGVDAAFNTRSNYLGQDLFLGNFHITDINSDKKFKIPIIRINSACKDRWNRELPKAVAFWRNWLKDPITRKKVENNYPDDSAISGFDLFSTTVEEAFDMYEKSLSNLKLMFYDNTMALLGSQKVYPRAYAFVTKGNNYHIYVNCSFNDPDPYGTLIHEIQHIIYNIKPLNPGKKIKDAFVTNKTVKQTTQQIQSLPTSAAFETALIASSKLGIDADYLNYWKKAADDRAKSPNPGYVCRTNWDGYASNYPTPPAGASGSWCWSDSQLDIRPDNPSWAWLINMSNGTMNFDLGGTSNKNLTLCVRSFRCVSY